MVYNSLSGEGGPSEREQRRHPDGRDLLGYAGSGRRIASASEHVGGFAFSSAGAAETVSYSAVMLRLWRRKFLLASIAIVAICCSVVLIARLPAHYVAHAFVAIGDPAPRSRLVNAGQGGGLVALPDAGAVQTEVEVLRSPQLAFEVIRDLKLDSHPEFKSTASEEPPSIWARVKGWLLGSQATAYAAVDGDVELSQTVDNFLGRLRVSITNNSRMVDVAFDSSDPRLSMQVTNAIVDRYLTKHLEWRLHSAQRTSGWLQDKIAKLQDKVVDGERAVEQFRAQAGLFSAPDRSPLLLKQMTDVSVELANAQTARAAIEARLGQLRGAVQPSARGSPTSEVVDSPFMRTLDGQQADTEQKLAEASATMGDKNPTTAGLRERLRNIQAAKRNEGLRFVASLEHDLKVARMKEQDLRDRVSHLQNDIADMNRAEIKLRALEREAQADRLILSNFISRFKETSQESDTSSPTPDAQIVSYAKLPVSPDRPKRGLLIIIASVASVVGAAMVVLLVDKADRRMLTLEHAEDRLKVAALGMLTFSQAAQLAPSEAARYGTSYREAAKAIYARLFWGRASPKVTLVTSALAGEGKTTLALSLAAMAAQSGQRALLVDADFWKSGANTVLGIRAGAGLAELLEGRVKLSDAIVCDVASGADVILPGVFSRASLLAWIGKLPELLQAMKSQYDVVIIDGPPVLEVSEGALLASHADATVIAVRWASTPCDAALSALKRLRLAGAEVAGSVLTMAKVDDQRGYRDAAYYAKPVDAYRAERGALGQAAEPAEEPPVSKSPASLSGPESTSRYALLVLDVREVISSRRRWDMPSPAACDRLITRINYAAQAATRCDFKVLYVHGRGDPAGKAVGTNTFIKRGADAFTNRHLDSFLRKNGVTHIFLAGVDAAMSIKHTAQSALDLGYRVTFIQDAIFTAYKGRWEQLLSGFESAAAFTIKSAEFADFAAAAQQANEAERRLQQRRLDTSPAAS
jgi:uncharacterized protein involved in exopolysaccharide biosynthesis/MinD-like ATPase involved in chromosome partitioning or flagellar assembly